MVFTLIEDINCHNFKTNLNQLSHLKIHEEDFSKDNSKQIEKDLDRTFPGIPFFQTKECHDKMFRVLKAFSHFNKEISK